MEARRTRKRPPISSASCVFPAVTLLTCCDPDREPHARTGSRYEKLFSESVPRCHGQDFDPVATARDGRLRRSRGDRIFFTAASAAGHTLLGGTPVREADKS